MNQSMSEVAKNFTCPKCGVGPGEECRYVWPSWCTIYEYSYPGIAEVWLDTSDWPKLRRAEMARTDKPTKLCHQERYKEAKERMNCEPCKSGNHDDCVQPKTCVCQHRTTVRTEDDCVAPTSEWGGALKDPEAMRQKINDVIL